MGRAAVLTRGVAAATKRGALIWIAIAVSLLLVPPLRPDKPAPPARILGIEGLLDDPRVVRHVDFGLDAGFDALWIRSEQAGVWTGPDGPDLDPAFVRLCARARERQARIFLELRPAADRPSGFVFTETEDRKRLLAFVDLARKRAGVGDFVVSFSGAPTELTDLRDLLEYGRSAAAAHVDLVDRVERRIGRSARIWFLPALNNDRQLDDPRQRYPAELFKALPRLSPSTGLVWTGPDHRSVRITRPDLDRFGDRIGRRPVVLEEHFPANDSGPVMPLALVLSPLRHRDPAIVSRLSGYLFRPMRELGASRLSLLTAIDFLNAPTDYDPNESWRRAISRLAGAEPETLQALQTQSAEWGGFIGGRNYDTALTDNPYTAAQDLRDPARVASWSWTVKTYPDRMAALRALADRDFRDDLLLTMSRRLSVARAVPLARELVSREVDGTSTVASLRRQISEERKRVAERPEVLEALDRFLGHAGLGALTAAPEPGETIRPARETPPAGSAW